MNATDIVKRLRGTTVPDPLLEEAADEIERLRVVSDKAEVWKAAALSNTEEIERLAAYANEWRERAEAGLVEIERQRTEVRRQDRQIEALNEQINRLEDRIALDRRTGDV